MLTRVVAALACCVLLSACDPAGGEADFDVIIRNGTVVDGTGRPGYVADVGVSGGAIARIGDLSESRGAEELEAAGMIVAPGFINLHSHAYLDGLPTAVNMLSQGVTTEIINADGGSPLDLEAQLAEATAGGLAINVGGNIGFNSVWASVMGQEDRRPTSAELSTMAAAIDAGLEDGAWGVSAGLDYKPAYFATADDVMSVLQLANRWRTVFTNHDRLTPESGFSSMVGMRETIEIGEGVGVVPVITHMKVQGREQGSIDDVLTMMDEATDRGAYTAADAYPYLAGQTSLAALIIPGWAQEGGTDAMLSRFVDPEQRARIVAEADEALAARFGGPGGVFLPETQTELTAIMDSLGTDSGGDAVVRILERERPTAILRFGAESDLQGILRHPSTSVACDCDASAEGASHPRGFGTFPRVLGRYVREQGVLTMEDAVRKMTGLPATTIGMVDRGFVASGKAADLVVFDPTTIIDHATYADPTARSEGIVHVLVNGVVAYRDGEATGAQGGLALRRGRHEPAWPMALDVDRSLALDAVFLPPPGGVSPGFESVSLHVDVSQASSSRAGSGLITLTHPDGSTLVSTEIGLLQTHERWAAVTARMSSEAGTGQTLASAEAGAEQTLILIVDGNDRFAPGYGWTVSIRVDGQVVREGRVSGEVTLTPS